MRRFISCTILTSIFAAALAGCYFSELDIPEEIYIVLIIAFGYTGLLLVSMLPDMLIFKNYYCSICGKDMFGGKISNSDFVELRSIYSQCVSCGKCICKECSGLDEEDYYATARMCEKCYEDKYGEIDIEKHRF
jgi:hypothetical protein